MLVPTKQEYPLHEHMIAGLVESEEKTLLKDKATAIIATCQADLKYLMWSLFSLFLRTDRTFMEHAIVVINGPDKRTGDPSLQDKKEKFLHEFRDECDMPITVTRTWSRIGHCQAIESAIPWVHTEYYLLMHDDIIVDDEKWPAQLQEKGFLQDPMRAVIAAPPLLLNTINRTKYNGKNKVGLPHINTAFALVRKAAVVDSGAKWYGYHIPKKFTYDHSLAEFMKYHGDSGHFGHSPPKLGEEYEYINTDVGAWVYYNLRERGYRFHYFGRGTVFHFGAASWDFQNTRQRLTVGQHYIKELEEKIKEAGHQKLYERHLNG